jgi:hypothetical protein
MTVETSYINAVINIVVTGFGLGITMPLYTIAVQNAVPYKVMGVATSSIAFFRSLGGSVGLAIFGSVLNNRFASEFLGRLPADVTAVVPAQQLDALAHNPQALMSAEAQAQLRALIEQVGQNGDELFQQVLLALRQSLDSALSHIFLYALLFVVAAFIINLFIKEIPLRRQHNLEANPPEKK